MLAFYHLCDSTIHIWNLVWTFNKLVPNLKDRVSNPGSQRAPLAVNTRVACTCTTPSLLKTKGQIINPGIILIQKKKKIM